MSGGANSARYRVEGVFYPIILPGYRPNGSPERFSASLMHTGPTEVKIGDPQSPKKYAANRLQGAIILPHGATMARGAQFTIDNVDYLWLHSNRLDDWSDITATPVETYMLRKVDEGLWAGHLGPFRSKLQQAKGLVACCINDGTTRHVESNPLPTEDVPALLRGLAAQGKIKLPKGFPTQ
jgi:hypothetical protein